jgi:hypothetical protein
MSNYTARSLMGKTRSITALGAHRTVRPKNALDMLESLGFVVELRAGQNGDRILLPLTGVITMGLSTG